MVEPDLHIAGFLQRIRYRVGLIQPFEAVRKPGVVDHALMLLEAGDMRVTEHGEAVGAKLDAAPDGVETGGKGLVRQSVDQVEIDATDAGAPQAFHRRSGLLKALHP